MARATRCERRLPEAAAERPLVLVVEPDGETRTLIRLALCDGYDVVAAATETEAVAAMQEWRAEIALILMDVSVAGSQGEDALTPVLRREKLGRRVPVIGTGTPAPGDQVRAVWIGCDDYLPKPFYVRELLSLVGEHAVEPPASGEGV